MPTTPRDVIIARYHFVDKLLQEPTVVDDVWLVKQLRERFKETPEIEAERIVKERQEEEANKWIVLVEEKWVDHAYYSGPVTIKVRKNFYAPDLYVCIDDNGIPMDSVFDFEDDQDWKNIIIGLLQDTDHLDSDRLFDMWSAESGMQGSDFFVYEGIEDQVTGEWISHDLCIEWGAKDAGAP